jgi:23S rRNA (cytosine1962-C5)-methyltransferase
LQEPKDWDQLPLIRLGKREDRRLRRGHRWIYEQEIADDPRLTALATGASVIIADSEGRPVGTALWNAESKIRARLFTARAAAFPQMLPDLLAKALALRERLYPESHYRLIFGESDGMPGLTVDRFGAVLVAQIASAAMEAHAAALGDALLDLPGVSALVLRRDAAVRAKEGLASVAPELRGELPDSLFAAEGGLRFSIDPLGGMKGGWFWDQRDSRSWLSAIAKGCRVLDLFCHTGGFGIRAAKSGAGAGRRVVRSEPALAMARESAALAGLSSICRFKAIDLFGGPGEPGWPKGHWDLVVLDPPALTRSRRDVKTALGAYDHLNRKAAGRVAPGGILLSCSCTFPIEETVWQGCVLRALRRAGRQARVIHRGGQGADHPVLPGMPETRYLKVLGIQLL